ncbi:MAG: alpha/beta hydrolase family esterase [Alphaproteobacteria bacterium]
MIHALLLKQSHATSLLSTLLLLIIMTLTTVNSARAATQDDGLERRIIEVQGIAREFFVHVPAKNITAKNLPVLFVLHGGKGKAPARARQTGMNIIADRDGFIAVYPQGLGGYWISGPNRPKNAVDDVAFFRAMIDALVKSGEADPGRIYVMGGSNGGMMTYHLACAMPERLAAVAAIVASMPDSLAKTCRPIRPLPILIMAGTADPLMPYQGGLVAHGKGKRKIGSDPVISISQTLDLWRYVNGCSDKFIQTSIPDRDPDDGITTEIYRWTECAENTQVQLYQMLGAGHGLPGRSANKSAFSRRMGGNSTNDFDSSEASWGFLRQFSR